MKTLTPTLEAAQKADSRDPYLKVVVGAYTFGTDRILKLVHEQQPFSDNATITIDNSDGLLTGINLRGDTLTMGLGFVTGAGNEYIDKPRMKVMSQIFNSSELGLTCELRCVGMLNEIGEDRADERFEAEDETVQTLVSGIFEATLAPYNQCEPFTVQYDTVGDLIGTVVPGSSFRINTNGSRLAAGKRLLDITWCVMRPENDGKIHIFKPVSLGEVYDYEYELGSGKHEFFTKSQSNTLVIPNYITVRTNEDADPYYEGSHAHTGSIAAYKTVGYHMIVNGLTSNEEAEDIAEAILSKFTMHAINAGAEVPVNVGAEIFDYVNIIDSREGTSVAGNIGYIRTGYGENEEGRKEFNQTFGLGKWLHYRHPSDEVGGLPGEGEQTYFQELVVDTLYLSPITLDYIEDGTEYQRTKSAALSAEGLVLLDETIAGTYSKVLSSSLSAGGLVLLDETVDGTYERVLATQLSAGKLYLSSSCIYQSGYNPTTKMAGDADLDDIPDGVNYKRVLSTQLSAGKLYLTSSCIYGSGYDPTTKFDLNFDTLDDIPNGASYGRVLLTDLSAGHLYIYEGCIFKDDYDPTDKFDMGDDTLDNIPDGMTYKKLLGTQISAGKIYLSSASIFAPDYDPSEKWTGTDLDDLPDGTLYARLKQSDMQAGHIYLTDEAYFAAGYDPTGKFDLGAHNLDNVPDGYSYHKLLATHIDSGRIKLTSNAQFEGTWYTDSDITIQAGVGIKGVHYGVTQFELSSTTGKIRAAAGDVVLDASGIRILGQRLTIASNTDVTKGYFGYYTTGAWTGITIQALDTHGINLLCPTGGMVWVDSPLMPYGNGVRDFGAENMRWKNGFFSEAFYIGGRLNIGDGSRPVVSQTGDLGGTDKWYNKMYSNTYYGKNTDIQAFQGHDDIAMLKAIRPDSKGKLDIKTFPAELLESDEDIKESLGVSIVPSDIVRGYDVANWQSLLMGSILQLNDRVEKLEVVI